MTTRHEHATATTVNTDPPITLLEDTDGTVRVEHVCDGGDRWPDGVTHVVAPELQLANGGHTLTRGPAGITVTPSILCPDCGLHGYITDSTWRPA